MWRLWTRGWGPRAWWYWVHEALPRQCAFLLPRRVAYWAYLRVLGEGEHWWDHEAVLHNWNHPMDRRIGPIQRTL